MDDVAGLKIRTMENQVHIAFWKAMGADATPMSWGEAYTALQQGALDGQETQANRYPDKQRRSGQQPPCNDRACVLDRFPCHES